MKRLRLWLLVAAGLATPSVAREVNYAAIDTQGFAALAARLKIAPITSLPSGALPVTLTATPATDHEVLRLGQYCDVMIKNPVSQLVALMAAPPPQSPSAEVAITRARSFRRCLELSEMNIRCITRVTLDASVTRPDQPTHSLSVVVERDASVGGFCEDVAQGVGVVTRQALHELIAKAVAGS
jgi:hypothetical protein